jgi:predicted AAA+ superfamily ATPase
MLERHLTECVLETLKDTPVVYIQGARQTGKSTLVQAIAKGTHPTVKAGTNVQAKDFAGLHLLAELTGKRFRHGFVLHTGDSVVPFGKNLHALPIQTLWR